MTSTTYAMSASDYKEYFNKDYEHFDDDDFVTLEVECVDEPTDGVAEYSIKWKNNDNDENGIINGINTSSPMALMTCGWRCDDSSESESEEEEFEYTTYAVKNIYKVIINVAGGGMMNGNAYANIEGEWPCEDAYMNGEEGEIYYCEYGNNPVRNLIGSRIVYDDEGYRFNVVD